MSQCRDTHVAYSADMLGGRIDRDAWALVIDAFIDRFDGGNKSAFATRIGLTRQTLIRWLARKTDISHESVRQVFDRLKITQEEQAELLARIGYLAAEPAPPPPAPVNPSDDPVIRMILDDPQWTEAERTRLVKRELERIKREEAQRVADYEWYLQQRREARDTA